MSGITPLPAPPSTSDPSNFSTRADDFLAALPTFATEANDLAAALNNISTTSTSVTSNTIGTGSKAFTVEAGKSYFPGQSVTIARTSDTDNRMFAVVDSYDSGTGALVVTSQAFEGSGTFTDWTITLGFNGIVSNAQLADDAKFGRLLNRRIITASETGTAYTTGATKALVRICGGGGGGGGVQGVNPGTVVGYAGNGGGYTEKLFNITQPTYTVTIGAGGNGGASGANNGTAGGTTTFTDGTNTLTANGGAGGSGLTGSGGNAAAATNGSGGTSSGGDLNLSGGDATARGWISGIASAIPVSGAAPFFGGGKTLTGATTNQNGPAGTNPGEGGSGGYVRDSNVTRSGGAGFRGVCILEEYA